jgi:hypothetical protein
LRPTPSLWTMRPRLGRPACAGPLDRGPRRPRRVFLRELNGATSCFDHSQAMPAGESMKNLGCFTRPEATQRKTVILLTLKRLATSAEVKNRVPAAPRLFFGFGCLGWLSENSLARSTSLLSQSRTKMPLIFLLRGALNPRSIHCSSNRGRTPILLATCSVE